MRLYLQFSVSLFLLFQRLQVRHDVGDLLVGQAGLDGLLGDRIELARADRLHQNTRLHLSPVLDPAGQVPRIVREKPRGNRRPCRDVREIRTDVADHHWVALDRMACEAAATADHELRAIRRIALVEQAVVEVQAAGDWRLWNRVRRQLLARERDESRLYNWCWRGRWCGRWWRNSRRRRCGRDRCRSARRS